MLQYKKNLLQLCIQYFNPQFETAIFPLVFNLELNILQLHVFRVHISTMLDLDFFCSGSGGKSYGSLLIHILFMIINFFNQTCKPWADLIDDELWNNNNVINRYLHYHFI